MMPTLAALNAVSFYSAVAAGVLHLRAAESAHPAVPTARRRWPWTTACLVLAVSIPTIAQFFVPGIVTALRRDAGAIAGGEWWRLVTALFVQDGGLAGSVANVMGLLLIGSLAESLWSGRVLLAIFFGGGLCTEVIALWWQPVGAGNSIGNVSVAASLAIWCLVRRRTSAVIVPASTAIGAWAVLVLLRDIHGAAAVLGLVFGSGLSWRDRTGGDPSSTIT